MGKKITGLKTVTIAINDNFNATTVHLDTEKMKFVAVTYGQEPVGIALSEFNVGRIATNHKYSMKEVAGALQTSLIAHGYVGYTF